ncbi:hypothetical protein Syun_014859 [Stephania yunnanensis]|uniref:Response regulatory domain-containing protein n=1 Tax=Stephania yunnanensis TaxID=152371 RepID=A0AAP0JKL4_9MAGN
MLILCVATLDLDRIPLPKNSRQAMKYGRNTSRHYQMDTFSDYDDLRIIVENAISSGRYLIGLGDDTNARTFEADETSGDVLEDLTYDYDAEAFVDRFMARDQGCWKLIEEIPDLPDSTRFKVMADNDNFDITSVQLKNRLTVLIVEYSQMLRYYHKTVLTAVGANCIELENGLEALNLCRSGAQFDLIIMDMDMFHLEGIRTTITLRAMGVHDKILGLTSRSRECELQALMDLGLDYCVELPLTPARLVSIAKEIDDNLG